MSRPTEQFPLSQLDHTKYNFKDPDSLLALCKFAKSFVAWLPNSPGSDDLESTQAKIRTFVNLITANNDPELAVNTFRQVSFHIPELRSNRNITSPRSAIEYLLLYTQFYRPSAVREEVPQGTIYFARSVARQLESFELTQRQSGTEDRILQAVINSLSVPEKLGSSSATAGQPLTARKTPQSSRSAPGTGSPGASSPGAGSPRGQQIQNRPQGQHTRTLSGAGTSGRREESESGSLRDLRTRRPTIGSVAGSSPQSSPSSLVGGMRGLTVHHGVSPGTSTYGVSSGRATAPYTNVPNISPFTPEQLQGARHTGMHQAPSSPAPLRGRSNTLQPSTTAGYGPSSYGQSGYGSSAYGPSAYTAPRREPSQTRGESPKAPGSAERGRSGARAPEQPRQRDSSTGSTGTTRMFAPRPVSEAPRQATDVSHLSYTPGRSSSRQPATSSGPQTAAPRSQSTTQQPAPASRSSSRQPTTFSSPQNVPPRSHSATQQPGSAVRSSSRQPAPLSGLQTTASSGNQQPASANRSSSRQPGQDRTQSRPPSTNPQSSSRRPSIVAPPVKK